MDPHARGDRYILLLVCLLGLFYVLTLRTGHTWGDDFAQYVAHACNIATGRPYADMLYIRNPIHIIGPQAYPPLTAVLLAPGCYFSGANLTVMKLILTVLFCAALLVLGHMFRARLALTGSLTLVALFGLNPVLWGMKDIIQSEYIYLLVSLLALLLIERHYQETTPARRLLSSLGVGVAIYLACATREVGLVLVPALVLVELMRMRRLTRYVFIALAVVGVLIMVQKQVLHVAQSEHLDPDVAALMQEYAVHDGGHAGLLDFSPGHLYAQSLRYLESIKDFWSPRVELGQVLATVASVLALAGFMLQLRRRITVFEIYTVGYCLLILSFIGYQGLRYLIPVMPLYLYYMLLGLQSLKSTQLQRLYAVLFVLILAGAAVAWIDSYRHQDYPVLSEGIATPDALEMIDFVSSTAGPDDIVVVRKPRALALLTGRHVTIYPNDHRDPLVLGYLRGIEAQYVVTERASRYEREAFIPVLERHPALFQPLFENAGYRVYRFLGDAPDSG